MKRKRGYEVLKFIMHGNHCYVSTDYVKGIPLIFWMKYHSVIPKEQMCCWILEIAQNLRQFHRCRDGQAYQYMNPYSVIVSEERVYLLDLGSRKQEELLHQMQHRSVRGNFLSPGNQYYQKTSEEEDIYGLGRTIQFMLASAEMEPPLSRWEEFKFQRVIVRCLSQNPRKRYHTVQEVLTNLHKNTKL